MESVRREEGEGSPERRERFRALYEAGFPRLLGYALRRTESAEDARDAVAETFLITWRRLDAVPDGPDARLWLYGVIRRVLANHRRSKRRGHRLLAALRLATPPIPSPEAHPDGPLATVALAFGRLREADRDILGLVAWEGLSSSELADVLGCTPGAARIRLHRARRRLAFQLSRLGVEVKRQHETGHVRTDGHPPVPMMEETR
jgi:RNA polymerase sigma-70 factor (ECF subfamily)